MKKHIYKRVMNVVRRGKETFPFGNRTLSITEILRGPGVLEFLESNGPLTDGSWRNKLRRKLRVGNFTKEVVDEFLRQRQYHRQREVARRPGPRPGRQGQTLKFGGENRTLTEILDQNPNIRHAYEVRGVRTPQAQRNRLRRDLMEGRDPLAPIPQRRRGPSEASPIVIDGERLTARQALERYPQLRGYLQPERRLSERALHARLRREFRNGRIPENIINEDPQEFFRIGDALDATVTEYRLDDPRIHHHDIVSIFEYLRPQILRLIEAHPNTKVYLNIHMTMFHPSSGETEKV